MLFYFSPNSNTYLKCSLSYCFETGMFNGIDYRVYTASQKIHDLDQPSIRGDLYGDVSHHCIEAIKIEIARLMKHKIWKYINTRHVPIGKKVFKDTCALKLKRLPYGTPPKYKAK